jgi:L-alanine-DL-glutamate epimerase-like enolase superfamily enzyme
MDLINLKINRMGGLTRARQIRDLCVSLGLPMNVEDSWGGEIATAAIAHLAHSTRPNFSFNRLRFTTIPRSALQTVHRALKTGICVRTMLQAWV